MNASKMRHPKKPDRRIVGPTDVVQARLKFNRQPYTSTSLDSDPETGLNFHLTANLV